MDNDRILFISYILRSIQHIEQVQGDKTDIDNAKRRESSATHTGSIGIAVIYPVQDPDAVYSQKHYRREGPIQTFRGNGFDREQQCPCKKGGRDSVKEYTEPSSEFGYPDVLTTRGRIGPEPGEELPPGQTQVQKHPDSEHHDSEGCTSQEQNHASVIPAQPVNRQRS